jgi:hypothetical protein
MRDSVSGGTLGSDLATGGLLPCSDGTSHGEDGEQAPAEQVWRSAWGGAYPVRRASARWVGVSTLGIKGVDQLERYYVIVISYISLRPTVLRAVRGPDHVFSACSPQNSRYSEAQKRNP